MDYDVLPNIDAVYIVITSNRKNVNRFRADIHFYARRPHLRGRKIRNNNNRINKHKDIRIDGLENGVLYTETCLPTRMKSCTFQ